MEKTRLTRRKLAMLSESLSELGVTLRNLNALEEHGVLTIEDALLSCPRSAAECQQKCTCAASLYPPEDARHTMRYKPRCYLSDVPNFGRVALNELFDKLAAAGFVARKD